MNLLDYVYLGDGGYVRPGMFRYVELIKYDVPYKLDFMKWMTRRLSYNFQWIIEIKLL
jgi:hypothetical protein